MLTSFLCVGKCLRAVESDIGHSELRHCERPTGGGERGAGVRRCCQMQ